MFKILCKKNVFPRRQAWFSINPDVLSLSPCWVTRLCCYAWLCHGLQGSELRSSSLHSKLFTSKAAASSPASAFKELMVVPAEHGGTCMSYHSSHPWLHSKCEASPRHMKPCLKTKLKKQKPIATPLRSCFWSNGLAQVNSFFTLKWKCLLNFPR